MSHGGVLGSRINAVGKNMSALQVPSSSSVGFGCVARNGSPPLLGSPYSCGVWSPMRKRLVSPSTLSITSSESSMAMGTELVTSPEWNSVEDEMFLEVSYAFRRLQSRLDVLLVNVKKMRVEADGLSQNFQKMITNADKKFRALSKTRTDIADKIYLDQLICLLNGDLQHLQITKWPFRITKTDNEPLNLVI